MWQGGKVKPKQSNGKGSAAQDVQLSNKCCHQHRDLPRCAHPPPPPPARLSYPLPWLKSKTQTGNGLGCSSCCCLCCCFCCRQSEASSDELSRLLNDDGPDETTRQTPASLSLILLPCFHVGWRVGGEAKVLKCVFKIKAC